MNPDQTAEKEALSVSVTLLGGFSMRIGDLVITDELNRSMKIWNLLAYLIVNRHRNIPQSEFIEMLWPDDDSGNPLSALKTLFFRMRKMISEVFGEDIQLLVSQRGSYSWNRSVKCRLDTEEFEEKCRHASNGGLPDETRLALYREALPLYKGDFLPKLSNQLWTVPLSAHYHAFYLDSVKEYISLLEKNERYTEMNDACLNAIRIDSLDEELHTMLLRSYMYQGKHDAALSHYKKTTEYLYRTLGVHPSKELRKIYNDIMKFQKSLETDLGIIQENLKESASRPGAFVCDYGFFREAYRLAARQASRDGTSIHILLITVSMPDGSIPPLEVLNQAMDQLVEEITSNLRRGDVVSRYSGAQYIIMLPSANYEDSIMISNRITSSFHRRHRYSPVKLNCSIQQMEFGEMSNAVV